MSSKMQCVECESLYNKETSKIEWMCPECAHIIYGYPNCTHQMQDGRCSICDWDGSRSRYIKSRLFEPAAQIPENKKKVVLLTVGMLFEMNEDELAEDYNTIDHFEGNVRSAIDEVFSIYKNRLYLGWNSSRSVILDPETMNCRKCAKCDAWVTDMDKPNPILELDPGTIVDGLMLCEDDLPE